MPQQPHINTSAPSRPFSYQMPVDDAPLSPGNGTNITTGTQVSQMDPYTPIEDSTQDENTVSNLVYLSQAHYQPHRQPAQFNSATTSPQTTHPNSTQPEVSSNMDARAQSPYRIPPPTASHPAYAIPQAEDNASPPIPPYSPTNPHAANQAETEPNPKLLPYSPDSYAAATAKTKSASPYTPYSETFSAGHPSPKLVKGTAPIASPGAAVTIDSNANMEYGHSLSSHQPGQISHPNMNESQVSGTSWRHSLCAPCGGSDASTCLLGLCCPCVVYSKTQYRLSQRSKKADPTDMLGFSSCNGHCILWTIACGFQGILTGIMSTRVRHSYKLEGGVGEDMLTGCCCGCCALVRNEREVRTREEERWRNKGPSVGYKRVETMRYSPA